MVTVLFDGEIDVHYGFGYVFPADGDPPGLDRSRGGQVNGLCGAACPGTLSLVTGLHTGRVPITVEVLDAEPGLEAEWEEAVEVSVTAPQVQLRLQTFQDGRDLTLPAAGTYRVRCCAARMDAARAADVRMDGDPVMDRYRLQWWPAPARADAVLRQTSDIAAYWHRVARETPPPPPPPTPAELAAAEQAAAERAQAEQEKAQEQWELQSSGGRLPSDRLRALGGRAVQLARADRDLAEAVVALGPAEQRAIAAWAGRRACAAADVDTIDWIAAGLAALDRGAVLPPPFDDPPSAWQRMFPGPSTVTITIRMGHREPERPVMAPEATAIDAVLAAGAEDPARAAVDALDAACGAWPDLGSFSAEVRQQWPQLE